MKQLINSLLINYSGGRGCAALLGDGYLVFFALCFFFPCGVPLLLFFNFGSGAVACRFGGHKFVNLL
jgi:hypothetical protein